MPTPMNTTDRSDGIELTMIHLSVIAFAVEALIATHPEPAKLRDVFDQLFAQFQVGIATSGAANLAAAKVMREFSEKIFSKSP